MATKFGTGYIELGMRDSKFRAGLKSAVGTMVKAAAVAGGLTAAVFYLSKKIAKSADEIGKMSIRTGESAENLQKWSFAAELGGASAKSFTTGLKKISQAAYEASRGTKTYTDLFKAVGVEWDAGGGRLRKLTPMIMDMADKFQTMTDTTKKAALASQLLGRAGMEMIPMLNMGSKAIKEQFQLLEDLGAVMGGDLIKASATFNDQLLVLTKILDAIKISFGNVFIPMLNRVVGGMISWWKANKDLILQNMEKVFTDMAGALNDMFTTLAILGPMIQTTFSGSMRGLKAFNIGLSTIALSFSIIIDKIAEISDYILESKDARKPLENLLAFTAVPAWMKIFQAGSLDDLAEGVKRVQAGRAGESKKYIDLIHKLIYEFEHGATAGEDFSGKILKIIKAMEGLKSSTTETTKAIAEFGKLSADTYDIRAQMGGFGELALGPLGQFIGDWMEAAGHDWAQELSDVQAPLRDLSLLLGDELTQSFLAIREAMGGAETGTTGIWESMFLTDELQERYDDWKLWADEFVAKWRWLGMSMQEVTSTVQGLITGFFSDMMVSGVKSAGKKFLAAIIGIMGKLVIRYGSATFFTGLANYTMGLSDPLKGGFPNPYQVAMGKKQMVTGALLMAGGGALSGISSVIGGTSGGGGGTSFQSGIARPYGETVQPVTFDTSTGGGTVINVYANDAQSFNDMCVNNPSGIITALTNAVDDNDESVRNALDGARY